MSQFWVGTSAGNLPPSVLEQVNTQLGNAIPSNHILLLNGYQSSENNVNGITTKGNTNSGSPPGSGATNEADVYLTNRYQATVSFSDANLHTIFTFPLGGTAATYLFQFSLVAYNVTSALAAGYTGISTFRTTGAVASLIPSSQFSETEEGAMSGVNVFVSATAFANSFTIQVQGYNTDTLDWNLTGTYIQVT